MRSKFLFSVFLVLLCFLSFQSLWGTNAEKLLSVEVVNLFSDLESSTVKNIVETTKSTIKLLVPDSQFIVYSELSDKGVKSYSYKYFLRMVVYENKGINFEIFLKKSSDNLSYEENFKRIVFRKSSVDNLKVELKQMIIKYVLCRVVDLDVAMKYKNQQRDAFNKAVKEGVYKNDQESKLKESERIDELEYVVETMKDAMRY